MITHKSIPRAFVFAAIFAGTLQGCATYKDCGFGGCAGDAQITANVQTLFNQHPELGPPSSIQVQTLDHVVYLDGFVAAGLESSTAESVAHQAPGVTRVVNTIAVSR
jgi:osmotically-inducible protein OsmY